MIPLPRRGGGGVEWGGDACIALGGAVFAFHPRLVLEPLPQRVDTWSPGMRQSSPTGIMHTGYSQRDSSKTPTFASVKGWPPLRTRLLKKLAHGVSTIIE